jgi:hypothetical protein
MLAGGVIHGVEARDRAADAPHPEFKKHADGLRRAAHHIVDQVVKSNGHPRLRSRHNGNAAARKQFVPAQAWRAFLRRR